MAMRNQAQFAFDEEVVDDVIIEVAFEEREKRKASLSAVRSEFKEAHDKATAAIAAIKLEVGSAARVGRFRITRTTLKARSVSFETEEKTRIQIGLVDEDAPAVRGGWTQPTLPTAVGDIATKVLSDALDEADLRPTGEVNADALRGEAERSSTPEPTPLRPRRVGNGRAQPPAPPA